MTSIRELEQPLRAWRAFRDVARATRTLAAGRAIHWAERVRHAEAHVALARLALVDLPAPVGPAGPRVIVAIGTDLGLCGSLNRAVADQAAPLGEQPHALAFVIGARLVDHAPLPGAIELAAPSSFEALESCVAEIEARLEPLPEPVELIVVFTSAVLGDGHPQVGSRALELHAGPPSRPSAGASVILDEPERFATQARRLVRHALLIETLTRASTSEHEARWRTMSRAFESASRKIDEQELQLRKLAGEQITQEMIEARQGTRVG